MGYYKSIFENVKHLITPAMSNDEIENIFCEVADNSDSFENMVFTYGVKRFTKRFKASNEKPNTIPAFVEIEKGKYIENPISIMHRVMANCANYYEATLDNCGEDDEVNTIPAKKALLDAGKVLSYLENDKKLLG